MSSFNKKNKGGPLGSPTSSKRKSSGKRGNDEADEELKGVEGLEFEDPFADEFEEEEYDDAAIEKENDDEYDDDGDDEAAMNEDGNIGDDEEEAEGKKQVWRPGIDRLADGETLEYDPSAYTMYHSLTTEWPCLSFDILRDTLGEARQRFPYTMFLASGSQADQSEKNKITLLKLTDLHKTGGAPPDSDNEDDEDEDLVDEDPTLEHINCPHSGGVNRLRSMPQQPGIIATMADNRKVSVFDLKASLASLMVGKGPRVQAPTTPAYVHKGHSEEGYALDWSRVQEGRLASGDCSGAVHVWSMGKKSSEWTVGPKAFRGHTGSVEDIQWSPTEATVFGTSSTDKTVRIWDIRGEGPQITVSAHNDDVNVISWNHSVGYLMASGCDDGSFKVWDLRTVREGAPLANFTHHKRAITSLEWAPHDESVLCVSSEDNQVTVWDLSVEADDEDSATGGDDAVTDFPPQLLFIHQGQNNVKEVHFHPQIPGLIASTAEDGFNVFKPAISVA